MPKPGEFEASLAPRNLAALRIEARLGVILIPTFWLLDWLVLPEQVWTLLWMRATPTVCGLALLAACRWWPAWCERHVTVLAFAFSLLVAWSIAVM